MVFHKKKKKNKIKLFRIFFFNFAFPKNFNYFKCFSLLASGWKKQKTQPKFYFYVYYLKMRKPFEKFQSSSYFRLVCLNYTFFCYFFQFTFFLTSNSNLIILFPNIHVSFAEVLIRLQTLVNFPLNDWALHYQFRKASVFKIYLVFQKNCYIYTAFFCFKKCFNRKFPNFYIKIFVFFLLVL